MLNLESIKNTILQGDSTIILKQIPANSIDLIFADPPYNLQLKRELFRPNETKVAGVDDLWDKFSSFKSYDDFCFLWLKECKRILKESGVLWVIGSYHNIFRLGKIIQDLDFWILNDILWIKLNPMPNFKGKRFSNAHETLIWAAKSEKSKYTFNYKSMKIFNDDKQMRSDWVMPICSGAEREKDEFGLKVHSTQKPLGLLKRVLLSSSKEGDLVLDPFFGSGTTGAVAKMLKRDFIGIEREKKYIETARKRIQRIETFSPELLDLEAEKKSIKVPFGNLVESEFIKVGERLYSKDKRFSAVVLVNGGVRAEILGSKKIVEGSIHKVSSILLNKTMNNGWSFWCVEREKKLISIDELRGEYKLGKNSQDSK